MISLGKVRYLIYYGVIHKIGMDVELVQEVLALYGDMTVVTNFYMKII